MTAADLAKALQSLVDEQQAGVDTLQAQLSMLLADMEPQRQLERKIRAAIRDKNQPLAALKFDLGDIIRAREIKSEAIKTAICNQMREKYGL